MGKSPNHVLTNIEKDLDVIPYIFRRRCTKNLSQFAKNMQSVISCVSKYNLRMLEDRLVDIPKSRYQRRRYVKSYPKRLKELMSEAKNVLYSYEDVKNYRRGMLLVMARAGYRYFKNAVYAYKGASSIAEKKSMKSEQKHMFYQKHSFTIYLKTKSVMKAVSRSQKIFSRSTESLQERLMGLLVDQAIQGSQDKATRRMRMQWSGCCFFVKANAVPDERLTQSAPLKSTDQSSSRRRCVKYPTEPLIAIAA